MAMAKKTDGRRARAEQTRARMLDAAMRLFVENGYGATTIESIAQEAGVAVQTMYFSFGNKQKILKELIDLHVAGDDDPVPTLERPWVAEALAAADPVDQLRLQAQGARAIYERVGAVLEVLRNAAVVSGDAMELWRTNQHQRLVVQGHFVDALAKKRPLPEGLGRKRAVDICYGLLGPELYHLLVHERGWTPRQWERWVFDSLCDHLIDKA
ncbi:TetR/AcrR family transcriptional regulator [Streptantibioticus ferralitis]|uniref:Helix-turn-helix domain containing protein n=1 Tax=Streptantibioticus ferralitis TaxID=236510 RepID=A0ABT5YVW2_9ACTN|nr:TetR/AcrR family transcriptional regulator [Streptantibioticus ferralitis]MDF2255739.1 helix-turn-helix domain containing protein [Streptantibioticus ferralitis]